MRKFIFLLFFTILGLKSCNPGSDSSVIDNKYKDVHNDDLKNLDEVNSDDPDQTDPDDDDEDSDPKEGDDENDPENGANINKIFNNTQTLTQDEINEQCDKLTKKLETNIQNTETEIKNTETKAQEIKDKTKELKTLKKFLIKNKAQIQSIKTNKPENYTEDEKSFWKNHGEYINKNSDNIEGYMKNKEFINNKIETLKQEKEKLKFEKKKLGFEQNHLKNKKKNVTKRKDRKEKEEERKKKEKKEKERKEKEEEKKRKEKEENDIFVKINKYKEHLRDFDDNFDDTTIAYIADNISKNKEIKEQAELILYNIEDIADINKKIQDIEDDEDDEDDEGDEGDEDDEDDEGDEDEDIKHIPSSYFEINGKPVNEEQALINYKDAKEVEKKKLETQIKSAISKLKNKSNGYADVTKIINESPTIQIFVTENKDKNAIINYIKETDNQEAIQLINKINSLSEEQIHSQFHSLNKSLKKIHDNINKHNTDKLSKTKDNIVNTLTEGNILDDLLLNYFKINKDQIQNIKSNILSFISNTTDGEIVNIFKELNKLQNDSLGVDSIEKEFLNNKLIPKISLIISPAANDDNTSKMAISDDEDDDTEILKEDIEEDKSEEQKEDIDEDALKIGYYQPGFCQTNDQIPNDIENKYNDSADNSLFIKASNRDEFNVENDISNYYLKDHEIENIIKTIEKFYNTNGNKDKKTNFKLEGYSFGGNVMIDESKKIISKIKSRLKPEQFKNIHFYIKTFASPIFGLNKNIEKPAEAMGFDKRYPVIADLFDQDKCKNTLENNLKELNALKANITIENYIGEIDYDKLFEEFERPAGSGILKYLTYEQLFNNYLKIEKSTSIKDIVKNSDFLVHTENSIIKDHLNIKDYPNIKFKDLSKKHKKLLINCLHESLVNNLPKDNFIKYKLSKDNEILVDISQTKNGLKSIETELGLKSIVDVIPELF